MEAGARHANQLFSDDGFDGRVIEAEQAAIAAKDQQEALNTRVREQFDGYRKYKATPAVRLVK